MCVGAMVVLSTARSLAARDAALPFLLAAGLTLIVWLVHALWLREPPHDDARERVRAGAAARGARRAAVAPFRALGDAFRGGEVVGGRGGSAPRFFVACLFFQMAFQSFSSWFTLHGSERFHTTVANASLGFIAVAVSTLIGSMPAGWLGARYGRRRMSLIGLAGMTVACALMHVVPTLPLAVATLFLFGLSWSLPTANLPPMALELAPASRAGSLAGAYLLVASAAGVIGPSTVGWWFDVAGSKRSLFVALAAFLVVAFGLMSTLRAGFGEATNQRAGDGEAGTVLVPAPAIALAGDVGA